MIIALLVSTVVAAQWGMASVVAYSAEKKLSVWREQLLPLEQSEWESIRFGLEKALSLDPANPDLLHDLGLAYEAEFIYHPPGDNAASKNRQIAYQYYRQALIVRPVWPYHWVDLALVKYRLNEVDEEFYAALNHAVNPGPWEPGVQRIVTDIGLHGWNNFSRDTRMIILEVIQRGLQNVNLKHARVVLELVQRYDMLELICISVTGNPFVNAYCDRELQNRSKKE